MTCTRPGDTGTPAAALLKTLMADYGVSFQAIDRGYPGMRGVSGANDGCASYTETLQMAVSLATTEAWGLRSPRLFHRLFSEDKVELPWVVADTALATAIVQQITEIKSSTGPKLLMGRLYREMLPLADFAKFARSPYESGGLNPLEGVWLLSAYARLAGLDPKFVLVLRDKNGMATHHVAMKVNGYVVDPAYNMVEGQHQEVTEISPLQALSYRNLQKAAYLKTVTGITPLLEQALVLDPSNQRARAYILLVGKGGDDPLQPMRDAMQVQMAMAWR